MIFALGAFYAFLTLDGLLGLLFILLRLNTGEAWLLIMPISSFLGFVGHHP